MKNHISHINFPMLFISCCRYVERGHYTWASESLKAIGKKKISFLQVINSVDGKQGTRNHFRQVFTETVRKKARTHSPMIFNGDSPSQLVVV